MGTFSGSRVVAPVSQPSFALHAPSQHTPPPSAATHAVADVAVAAVVVAKVVATCALAACRVWAFAQGAGQAEITEGTPALLKAPHCQPNSTNCDPSSSISPVQFHPSPHHAIPPPPVQRSHRRPTPRTLVVEAPVPAVGHRLREAAAGSSATADALKALVDLQGGKGHAHGQIVTFCTQKKEGCRRLCAAPDYGSHTLARRCPSRGASATAPAGSRAHPPPARQCPDRPSALLLLSSNPLPPPPLAMQLLVHTVLPLASTAEAWGYAYW